MSSITPIPVAWRLVPRLTVIGLLLGLSASVALVSARPTSTISELDRAAVERAGLGLPWTAADVAGSKVAVTSARVLAVSPDGTAIAAASGPPGAVTDLVIARADGSQLRIAALDPSGALFSADGLSSYVIDGLGDLLRVDALTGISTSVVAGTFASGLVAGANGDLLALQIDSVEAPTESQLVRISPAGDLQPLLPDARLVYRAFVLNDGSIWALVHRPGGPAALIGVSDGVAQTAQPIGLDLDVSPDGHLLAWSDQGAVYLVARTGGGQPRSLGSGRSPRFARSSAAVLIERDSGAAVFGLDGELVTELSGAACWAGAGSCQP